MTTALLRERTVKDLAQMAKEQGVPGWHAMRKEQLIKALLSRRSANRSQPLAKAASTARKSKEPSSARLRVDGRHTHSKGAITHAKPDSHSKLDSSNGRAKQVPASSEVKSVAKSASPSDPVKRPVTQHASSRASSRAREALSRRTHLKDLSVKSESASVGRPVRDKIVLIVRDPYWLHVHWDICRASVIRAREALGPEWHGARPILRLYRVCDTSITSQADVHECDVEIHGGVNDWYIDVHTPPATYRADIGYLCGNGRFHQLARGNKVTTPHAGEGGPVDRHWDDIAEDFDRIYAMSGGFTEEGASEELRESLEERLRRPVQGRGASQFRGPADIVDGRADFQFHVDAEIIIYGTARPDAYVKVDGEPVRLREDGTFTMRLNLPDKRQIVPIIAQTFDGVEQRTAVLAFERNTKYMEPVIREPNEE